MIAKHWTDRYLYIGCKNCSGVGRLFRSKINPNNNPRIEFFTIIYPVCLETGKMPIPLSEIL